MPRGAPRRDAGIARSREAGQEAGFPPPQIWLAERDAASGAFQREYTRMTPPLANVEDWNAYIVCRRKA